MAIHTAGEVLINEVFELQPIFDDPRFEGFAMLPHPSILGRDSLDDDLTPGFDESEHNWNWRQPSLSAFWKPAAVVGRVSEFNDYPCVDGALPAFTSRAVDALRTMLEDNGELLALVSKTQTQYFLYNILTISDALDHDNSDCEFWCEPPTTAIEIEHFEFDPRKVSALSIFRIRELPMSVFVTSRFVEKVAHFGLQGFEFRKVWPLPRGVQWRMQKSAHEKNRTALKQQTLVVVLPFDQSDKSTSQIKRLEDSVDTKLQVKNFTDEYFGSYEGHDIVNGTYRMFFSTPNANILLDQVQPIVQSYEWPRPVVIHLRRGGLYEVNVKEETITI